MSDRQMDGAKTANDMVTELQQMRDETRVQLNLASKEVRDTFHELEKKAFEFEEHARRVGEKPLHELAKSYAHLRAALHELREQLTN